MVAGAATAAETPPPPGSPLNGLVKKFTEKRTAPADPLPASQPVAPPVAQPIAQPVAAPVARPIAQPTATAINRDPAAKKAAARKPSPPLASLPTPKAASGPLRILLVDDDWSDNNRRGGDNRRSGSDDIFRTLVAAAVGGEAAAWSVESVETHKHGPGFERLRDFNVVIWYTGAAYGGNPDNTGVLSLDDEKSARRYLREIGGAFILVSPGYVNNWSYGSTWTATAHPFLKEVAGINGFAGLVQRFASGTVQAHDGSSYEVAAKGAAEPQFSAVNPDGAAIVFTSKLDPKKTEEKPVPVATAHPFGGGRFVYVGFTFENIPEADRAKAFKILLDAATGPRAAVAATPRVTPTVIGGKTSKQRIVGIVEPSPPVSPPVPEPTGEPVTNPEEPNPKLTFTGHTYFKVAKVKIHTGNDNKEAPSNVTAVLSVNGSARDDNDGLNPDRLEQVARFPPGYQTELRVNSMYESVMQTTHNGAARIFEQCQFNNWAEQDRKTLAQCQQYGFRLDIIYEPNFILDAWKIERVELEIDFGFWEWWRYKGDRELGSRSQDYMVSKPAPGFPRVISFNRSSLLNDANKKLTLLTDGFFFPK